MNDSARTQDPMPEPQGAFLSGRHVILRTLTVADVDNTEWHNWFNDAETTRFLEHHRFPNTIDQQYDHVRSISQDRNGIVLGVASKASGELFGVISVREIDWVSRRGSLALVIGEQKYRSLLFAEDAVSLMLDHCFFELNLHSISAGLLAGLADYAMFLQRRFGFVHEGRIRETTYKGGEYVDVILLGLLRREYIAVSR